MPETVIKSLEELNIFARVLSAELAGGSVVALAGDLGSGKTTLTQLVAKNLGITNNLTSPTFSLLKVYPVFQRPFSKFCHIDLYRLDDKKNRLGLEEYLGDSETVCFVEWPEKIKNILPPNTVWLNLKTRPDNTRLIARSL